MSRRVRRRLGGLPLPDVGGVCVSKRRSAVVRIGARGLGMRTAAHSRDPSVHPLGVSLPRSCPSALCLTDPLPAIRTARNQGPGQNHSAVPTG